MCVALRACFVQAKEESIAYLRVEEVEELICSEIEPWQRRFLRDSVVPEPHLVSLQTMVCLLLFLFFGQQTFLDRLECLVAWTQKGMAGSVRKKGSSTVKRSHISE